MRIGLNFCAIAFVLSSVLLCNAPALAAGTDDPPGAGANTSETAANMSQPSGNVAMASGDPANSSQTRTELPFASNEGTLAESAKTTALSTSTYHQSTGFLPGLK
jgi:hypothetical protein